MSSYLRQPRPAPKRATRITEQDVRLDKLERQVAELTKRIAELENQL